MASNGTLTGNETMTTAEINSRLARLEGQLSRIAGVAVELTIRGERSFTVSTEGDTTANMEKVAKFFGQHAEVTGDYDLECDQTCLYIEV